MFTMLRRYVESLALQFTKLILFTSLVTSLYTHEVQSHKLCTTDVCKQTAASILANMDESVNPCFDFYKYACGNYWTKKAIPAQRIRANPISQLQDEVRDKLKNSIDKKISPNRADYLRKFSSYYKVCMDEGRIELNARQELIEEFKKLGGWPLLDSKWNKDTFEWKKMTYKFRNAGFSSDILLNVKYDWPGKKTSKKKYNLIIDRMKLSLSTETLAKGPRDMRVKAYAQYKIGLAEYLGADRKVAEKDFADVLEFEIKMSMLLSKHEENLKKLGRSLSEVTTLSSIQAQCPQVPWALFLAKILGLPNEPHPSMPLINRMPGFLSTHCNIIAQTSPRTLANYMFWYVAEGMVGTLGSKARQLRHRFFTVLTGGNFPSEAERWKMCVDHVRDHMPLAAAAEFINDGHFDRNTKSRTMQIIHYIRASYRETLEKIPWMDQDTREAAVDKLNAMDSLVAFPDELLDPTNLNTFYKDLKIHPDSFLKSELAFDRFNFQLQSKKFRGSIKRTDWTSNFGDATDVNAIYSISDNSFMIHAGILQGAFFNAENPKYVNFAGIGYIIGHEIMHAFDNTGHKYDKDGNEKNWWSKQTEQIFSKRAQCFVGQYNSLMTLEDVAENSNSALGENIADNEGLRQAYLAYERWSRENLRRRRFAVLEDDEEPRLPGLEEYSSRQMFWLAFANSHCVRYKRPMSHAPLSPHAPHRLRVLGPLINLDEFSRDFGCPRGSPMNPINKCRIW